MKLRSFTVSPRIDVSPLLIVVLVIILLEEFIVSLVLPPKGPAITH